MSDEPYQAEPLEGAGTLGSQKLGGEREGNRVQWCDAGEPGH